MDPWEVERHGVLVEETRRTCAQYLTAACREDSEEHRDKNYHSLVLQRNLRTEVRLIMDRETGGVLHMAELCNNTGERVM